MNKYIHILTLSIVMLGTIVSNCQSYCIDDQLNLNNMQRVLNIKLKEKNLLSNKNNCKYLVKFNSEDELYFYEKNSKKTVLFENYQFKETTPDKKIDTLIQGLNFYYRNWQKLINADSMKNNLKILVDSCYLLGSKDIDTIISHLYHMKSIVAINFLQKIKENANKLFINDPQKHFAKYDDLKKQIQENENKFKSAKERFEIGNFHLADSLFKKIDANLLVEQDSLKIYIEQCRYLLWTYKEKIIDCSSCNAYDSLVLWWSKIPLKTRQFVEVVVVGSENNDSVAICKAMLPENGFSDEDIFVESESHLLSIKRKNELNPKYLQSVMDLGMLKIDPANRKCFDLFNINEFNKKNYNLFEQKGKDSKVYCLKNQ